MAWELEIQTFDVAQGESALVIARNPTTGAFRSMLIDGGLQGYAEFVNTRVAAALGNRRLDYIVASHYDVDHSGGLAELMLNDNYSALALEIGAAVHGVVAPEIARLGPAGISNDWLAGATTGAFVGYTGGGYNDGHTDASPTMALAVAAGNLGAGVSATVNAAVDGAYPMATAVTSDGNNVTNRPLMSYYAARKPKKISKGLANLIVAQKAAGNLRDQIINYIFGEITPNARNIFNTRIPGTDNLRYSHCTVYDPGDTDIDGAPYPINDISKYINALNGQASISAYTATSLAAGNRHRATPVLGAELMGWNATAAAPHVYCLARGRGVYQNHQRITQDNGNGISIGLAIQFGRFSFFTGGDLPADGLQMMPGAFLNKAAFGNQTIIPAFKAGHHGSAHAINQAFLTAAKPVTSVISCGYKQFGADPNNVHPDQATINFLRGQGTINKYYLTNCKIVRNHVPASSGNLQLVMGNKSRIAGDNGYDAGERRGVAASKVHRGNITLQINEAESASVKHFGVDALAAGEVYRQFRVTYFEDDAAPGGARGVPVPIGISTDTIHFWQ